MDFHSGKASKSVYLNKSNLNSQIWNYYDKSGRRRRVGTTFFILRKISFLLESFIITDSNRTTVHCIGVLCVYQFLRSFRAVSSKGKGLGNEKSWTRQSLASIYFWSHSEPSHNSRCWLRRGICTHAMSILLSTWSVCCMNGNVLTRLEM